MDKICRSFLKGIILLSAIILFSGCTTLHYDTKPDKAQGYAEIIVKSFRGAWNQHIQSVEFESDNGCKGKLDRDTPFVDTTKFRVPAGPLSLKVTLYYVTNMGQSYTGNSVTYKYLRTYSIVNLSVNAEKGKRYFITSLDSSKVYTEEEWHKLSWLQKSTFLKNLWW
jgi:hypothetical protein